MSGAHKHLLRRSASGQLRSHTLERRIGVGADRLNGGQAHNDDQRQHTAYSTAVGPSSETRKRCTFKAIDFIGCSLYAAAQAIKRHGLILGRESVSVFRKIRRHKARQITSPVPND